MAFALVAAGTAYGSSSATATPVKPAGVAADDILFALLKHNANEDPTASPSGWSKIGDAWLSTPSSRFTLWWKVAGGSEPADYTWTWATAARTGGVIVAYRDGFDTADPIDVVSDTGYTTSNTTVRAASMTVAAANSPIIFFGATHSSSTQSFTPPTAPTTLAEDLDSWGDGARFAREIASAVWTGSGATGALDATYSTTTADKHAFAVVLNPAAGEPTLAVADCAHGHAVEAVALSQDNTLVVVDALHGHAADAPALTQANVLAISYAVHAHAVDGVGLTQAGVLAVADALHANLVDNVALVQSHILAVADALHAHAADNVALESAGTLSVANASHGHSVDSVNLTQAHVLVIQDTAHGHTVESVALSEAVLLAVADALHAHAVDSVALTQAYLLAVQSARHGHAVGSPALTQASVLVVSDALHAQLVDALVLRMPGVVGTTRPFVVAAADRVLVVAPSQRNFTVH